ncbi:MAG: hydroxymethylbilane synthase [Synergistaceae bacterium]|nr:hydroxymethylbilane synthase [Synergistaceae bacterium]
MAQVKIISDRITASWPGAEIIPVPITTSGDRNMSSFISDPSGVKGLFTLEIEEALRRREIDIAVHSLKDLPVNIDSTLPILAYSKRADPRDVLVGASTEIKIIGTSSLRRRFQAARIFPDAKILPLRGNIGTRLRKLDEGQYSAIILSAAGLERMGLSHRISRYFTVDEIVPSAGQGILACQGREGEDYSYLDCVNCETSRYCAIAERSFARAVGAGCNVPAGAFAEVHGETLTLRGVFESRRGIMTGRVEEAETVGKNLAEVILS